MTASARLAGVMSILVASASLVDAHAGPPFPIVSDRIAGAYLISVWTDPDTTDDGSPAGQFWVTLQDAGTKGDPPVQTRAKVAIVPIDRAGAELTSPAMPVNGDVSNQFAALVMDHEGRFGVRVDIDGPLGRASVSAQVDATYDLRPPPYMLALYLGPFLLVGLLWGRVLMRRRSVGRLPGPPRPQ